MEVTIENEKPILLEEVIDFEKSQVLFKKYWGCPIYSDKWRKQYIENFLLPTFDTADPTSIFGDYDVWKVD